MTKLAIVAISTAILTAPSPAHAVENWTGFYLDSQVGIVNASFGSLSEIDYNTAEFPFPGGTVDSDVTRLKLRGGYDLGRSMVYGLIGAVYMDFGTFSKSGYTIGLGAGYKATDNIIVSGEITRDSIDILGANVDTDSFALRVSIKF